MNCNFLSENKEDKCGKKSATIFLLFDPENQLLVTTDLCQIHSNSIITQYMQEYTNEAKLISALKEKRKKEKKIVTEPSLIQYSKGYDSIQDHYRRKNKISNYLCRSLTCTNEISKEQKRYSAIAIHSNGKFRHYFYFCSLNCVNQLKAILGLNVPILENQLSLSHFRNY